MPVRDLAELQRLIDAHNPAVYLVDEDPERIEILLEELARTKAQPLLRWAPGTGLCGSNQRNPIADTVKLGGCLAHIAAQNRPQVVHLINAHEALEHIALTPIVQEILQSHRAHRGMVIFSSRDPSLPAPWRASIPMVQMSVPTREEYFVFVQRLVADLRKRMRVEMHLTSEDVTSLLNLLQGMSFSLVRRVLTEAILMDGMLDAGDLERVLQAKREIIATSGVLEYFPADTGLEDVAGLHNLKSWLGARGRAFLEPARAAEFGLEPARGVLLLGVQGCGKSLAAKAVANAWSMPLIRLDPGRLYEKYMGESEKNLRRALAQCEALAPAVLWIDEIEKAFGSADDNDGGASQRIFGTLLTWLQEKSAAVFVIATANDIRRLPPELLRKGRFDEIFFVDLPRPDVREAILSVHLQRRKRSPSEFDLPSLVAATEGFSGAELEQVVVGALYAAFAEHQPLTQAHLEAEIGATRPLSQTMREPIEALRRWAADRTVPADAP